jgi:hypothetical protein
VVKTTLRFIKKSSSASMTPAMVRSRLIPLVMVLAAIAPIVVVAAIGTRPATLTAQQHFGLVVHGRRHRRHRLARAELRRRPRP